MLAFHFLHGRNKRRGRRSPSISSWFTILDGSTNCQSQDTGNWLSSGCVMAAVRQDFSRYRDEFHPWPDDKRMAMVVDASWPGRFLSDMWQRGVTAHVPAPRRHHQPWPRRQRRSSVVGATHASPLSIHASVWGAMKNRGLFAVISSCRRMNLCCRGWPPRSRWPGPGSEQ